MSNAAVALWKTLRWRAVISLLLGTFTSHVNADCECGYSYALNSTSFVFTDLLESDFFHLANISTNTDWRRQEYNISATRARGPYGESAQITQVISNPLVNNSLYSGPSVLGGDAGLQLHVQGGVPKDGLVPIAELNSVRQDMLWGSYRAGIKLTGTPGTCGAFFWVSPPRQFVVFTHLPLRLSQRFRPILIHLCLQYFNDSQEIDMEFLSSQFSVENNTFPVNLVLQSAQSAAQGFSTAGANNYVVANLPFNPTTAFHEYRIDFVPGSVVFYADSHVLATMKTSTSVPQPGHLILTHWSNGNPLWSAGPPTQDATMTISYVKTYFNSSLADRSQAFASRCKDPQAPNAICTIPDQVVPPDPAGPNGNTTANTYFFSNHENSTVGQIIYHENQGRRASVTWQVFIVAALILVFSGSVELR
jgi:hypothetical protein